MDQKTDLRVIRRRAREAYYEDGLIDIGMGIGLLLYALALSLQLLDCLIILLATAFLAPPILRRINRRVNLHRIGYVTSFRLAIREYIPLMIIVATVELMIFLPLLYSTTLYPWSPPSLIYIVQNKLILSGVVFASLSASVGLLTRQKRFYSYSLISLGLFFAGYFIDAPLPYVFVTVGVPISCVGVFFLRRFLVKHPVLGVVSNAEQ
jgi:hypothetical protein